MFIYNRLKICNYFAFTVFFAFLASSPAQAQLNGLKGLLGNKGGDVANLLSSKDLKAGYNEITYNFVDASKNMLTAHAITLEALGHKEKAAEYALIAEGLSAGDCKSSCVKKTLIVSKEANAEALRAMETSEEIDEESKKLLSTAVEPYLRGTILAARLPAQYSNWINNAKNGLSSVKSNPIKARKYIKIARQIPEVAKVSAALPSLIKNWSSTTKNFSKLAKKSGVDTKSLDEKVSEEF